MWVPRCTTCVARAPSFRERSAVPVLFASTRSACASAVRTFGPTARRPWPASPWDEPTPVPAGVSRRDRLAVGPDPEDVVPRPGVILGDYEDLQLRGSRMQPSAHARRSRRYMS